MDYAALDNAPPHTQLRPRGRPEFTISRTSAGLDSLFVALIFGSILFNQMIGKATVLIVLATTAAMIVLRWEQLPRVAVRCWPLFTIPVLCMASALWSDVPQTTLYYGALYTATALSGVLIGAALNRSAYIDGHFYAFAIYSLAAVFLGRMVPHGSEGMAFAGLAGSKNSSGDMAGVALLVTIAYIALKRYEGKLHHMLAGFALLPAIFWLLLLSDATGALIATMMAAGMMILWIYSRGLALQVRGGILVASVLLTMVAVATQHIWLPPIFDVVLELTGKNAGLTGRVKLWAFGEYLIAQRPTEGLGYAAFWLKESPEAQFLWKLMKIGSQEGFNFHSTPMEIIIHLGYLGFALAILQAAYAALPLLYRSAVKPYFSSIFACGLLAFWAVKTPMEVIAFDPMHFSTVAVYAIFAMGLRKDKPVQLQLPYRSA